jgi:hypothetical protein
MQKPALLMFVVFTAVLASAQLKPEPCDSRPADRDAIHAHIDSIFQAFINHDGAKLRATHAPEWRGYLEGSGTVIRGVDGYMKAVGGGGRPGNPNGMKSYKWVEFDCMFYGDSAIVPFVADVTASYNGNEAHEQLRIVDFYAKLNGAWIQAGSDTQASPKELESRVASYSQLPPPMKQSLLAEREHVWKAYFANERPYLEQVLPEELITIDPGNENFSNRDAVLKGAERFAQGGSKLVKLDFPNTEIQNYGNVVQVYSTYNLQLQTPSGDSKMSGHATETFVFRDGKWLNVGWHLDSAPAPSGTGASR